MSFKPVTSRIDFVELENEMLQWWAEQQIIDKYLHRNDDSEEMFSFLDGPITANNPMGVHHAWGRTYKDAFQRYQNLRGRRQRFQNGFDEQGLWVEVEVEKELGLRSKKDITELVPGDEYASLAKFINLCKERVQKYSKVQTDQSKRLGYFMDWSNSYHTSSPKNNFEIWRFLKACHDKGWVYKGQDSVPWCPRCGTAISQMEILTEDYKEVTHESIYFLLPIDDRPDESFLVWTTTPWTIPANVAVAINPEFDYVLVATDKGKVWIGKEANDRLKLGDVVKTIKGKELVGLKYTGPFDAIVENGVINSYKDDDGRQESGELDVMAGWHIAVAAKDLVVEGEGTGLVHIAPGAGAEDYKLGKEQKLAIIIPIDETATYVDTMGELSGKNAKKHPEIIIEHLQQYENGKYLFKTEKYKHRYPICWRCKTELVWRVVDEWYIAVDRPDPDDKDGRTYREQMIEVAKSIRWMPEFGLARELDWLNNLGDWLISKKRFWGLALPIFEDIDGSFIVIGSEDELRQLAVEGIENLDGNTPHRPWIDSVKIKSPKTGAILSRIPDVGNPWLDAGIVPFSTMPKEWFPADFITESFPGQFKNWFYALIAMSTVLDGGKPFNTVLGFATVRDEKGQEMHKSKGNSIEFNQAAEQVGAESMRWQYVTANPENNLNFGFGPAKEIQRRFFLIWWNVYNFFITYATLDEWELGSEEEIEFKDRPLLDQWILGKLDELIKDSTQQLDRFNTMAPSRALEQFIVGQFSTWYIRRSRDRVGPTAENGRDKESFYQTTYKVLTVVCQLGAPYLPFLTEKMYSNLTGGASVHLSDWPTKMFDEKQSLFLSGLINEMSLAREIVEVAHAEREKLGLKLKQPLLSAAYTTPTTKKLNHDVERLIADEINVKSLEFVDSNTEKITVKLDVTITEELKDEHRARELIRSIQAERKKLGCSLSAKVRIAMPDWPESQADEIKRQTLAVELVKGDELQVEVVE